jgi:hypothetical protein
MNVKLYGNDVSMPQLQTIAVNLDGNKDHMTLVFDETVQSSTYKAGHFTVHSTAAGGTSYKLTGGRVLSSDGPTQHVELSKRDRDSIKLLMDLAIDNKSTYVKMTEGGFSDMTSSAHINPAEEKDLKATFFADKKDPVMESFKVDINRGVRPSSRLRSTSRCGPTRFNLKASRSNRRKTSAAARTMRSRLVARTASTV